MKRDMDNMLRCALIPKEEVCKGLNQRILKQAEEEQEGMKRAFQKLSVAALLAVFIIGVSSVSVYAAWKYLTPDKVAEKM